MKIKIVQSFVTVPFSFYDPDEVVDVSAERAKEWIDAGLAIPAKAPEFAVKPQHTRRIHKS